MTKKAAVLGFPIHHSLSPKLHGFWIEQYQLDATYEAIEVKPGTLKATFERLKKEGYSGWNITVPHKEEALTLVDEVGEVAKAIGAINTVVVENGKLKGFNTDAGGFVENIISSAHQNFKGKHVMVLGAGGAARAIISGVMSYGASSVTITNRTIDKANALQKNFNALAERLGMEIKVVAWDEKEMALKGKDVLVNTTSLGMQGQPPLEINLEQLPKAALVNDIVYKPLETDLIKAAKAHGNTVIDGIGMLIWQAVPAFEWFFGKTPEVTEKLKKYMIALSKE